MLQVLVFSAFNYAATFSCRKIPCPRRSVGCSDRNNHLWVIFQQSAEGSGGRSVTNKMDSIKNQFHSCYRNEQWEGKKRQFNGFYRGGGLKGKKGFCLEEILTLVWNNKMCRLKNFKFWCGFKCVYEYFHWVLWNPVSVRSQAQACFLDLPSRFFPKTGDPCSCLCTYVMCAHMSLHAWQCAWQMYTCEFFPLRAT